MKEDIKTFAKTFNKEEAANAWIENYEKKSKEAEIKLKVSRWRNNISSS